MSTEKTCLIAKGYLKARAAQVHEEIDGLYIKLSAADFDFDKRFDRESKLFQIKLRATELAQIALAISELN